VLLLPAAVQVKPHAIGLSVPVSDRYGEPVLARMWHACPGGTGRLSDGDRLLESPFTVSSTVPGPEYPARMVH
jgi:hypothetical protein